MLAFVPMLFVSIGYSELNKADPDCGTTFTWGTRTFGPWVGWLGGWGIIAADVLVMASLAQVSGQYGFLLFGAEGIGDNPTSEWVLLVGVLFIMLLTYVCYRGIELSARVQRILLAVEVGVLVVFAVVALVRVAHREGARPATWSPSWSWFNPFHGPSFSKVVAGLLLMLFIYWGWDTSVSINEETADRTRNPGLAAIISTVLLLVMYFVVTLAAQAFAGVGTDGHRPGQPRQLQRHLLGPRRRGVRPSPGTARWPPSLLILMVLTSAAASTQTTILPTARTTLSMATYKVDPRRLRPGAQALPDPDRLDRDHGRRLDRPLHRLQPLRRRQPHPRRGDRHRHLHRLLLRPDRVHLRLVLPEGAHPQPARPVDEGNPPLLGGLMLYFAMGWSLWEDWNYNNIQAQSYTSWHLPFPPHSDVGGVFLIAVVSARGGWSWPWC